MNHIHININGSGYVNIESSPDYNYLKETAYTMETLTMCFNSSNDLKERERIRFNMELLDIKMTDELKKRFPDKVAEEDKNPDKKGIN